MSEHPEEGGRERGGPRLPKDSERRQATVVFADISGFTAMSEKLDPEVVTLVVDRCFSALADVVAAHGGHVDKYIGDCVMALFGVPTALEKAPQQALLAALDMRRRLAELNEEERLPVKLGMHVGINTGLVIAGHVGGEVKREFTVMGDAVNLASRLKDAAPTGSIWIGFETQRWVRDDFELKKLPPLDLKGKEKAVDAFELLAVKERARGVAPAAQERMISSPLVGRDHEIALLRACMAAAVRGEGSILNLVGEAGLGKSRLVAEASAGDDAREARVLEARSLSIGTRLSFHPFIDLLRQWAGIAEDEKEVDARAKLEAAVRGLLPDQCGDVFPFVATLMGMRLAGADAARVEGIEGEALETLIRKSMRELLERLAAVRPLVLVFEDLHWADRSSIRLLESLLRLVPHAPILFVHAFRPDWEDTSEHIRRVTREQYGSSLEEIVLTALEPRACETFVRNLLKTDDVPYQLLQLVTGRGEGNPFYIEEVVRALIDEGVIERTKGRLTVTERLGSVVIPGTIQGVIMARVDRLPERTRNILQVASVFGRSFFARLLAQVAPVGADLETELGYLRERQLIFERRTRRTAAVRRTTLTEEVQYVFQHALVQETIYESILQRTRKELHRKVAETIETTFADHLADFYAMLAYHFSRAEQLEKAEEYLFKAGDEAARSAASSEALGFFREASKLYLVLHGEGGDPKKKALLAKNIALALLNTGQLLESIEHFDRALEHLGERVPKGQLAVATRFAVDMASVLTRVYLKLQPRGTTKNLEHEREVCEILFHRGRAEITSDPRRLFLQTVPSGLRRFNKIDPHQVEHACSIYVSCAGVFAYSGISYALSRRMLEIAKGLVPEGSVRDEFTTSHAHYVYHYLFGDWDDAHAIDPELVDRNLRHGEVWDVSTYLGLDCDRRLRRGDFAGARRELDALLEINDRYGYGFAGTSYEGYRMLLLLEQRDLAEALRVAERYCTGRHEYAMQVFALAVIAKIYVLQGDRAAATAALTRAEEIAARSALISPWHQSSYLLSRLLLDAGRLEEARDDRATWRPAARAAQRSARRAVSMARRIAKERVETYQLAGRVAWLLGRQKQALGWWGKSLAEGTKLGARPQLARTHLEVGRRLRGAGAKPGTTLDGRDGAAHLARAEELFAELGLGWDQAQVTEPALGLAAGE